MDEMCNQDGRSEPFGAAATVLDPAVLQDGIQRLQLGISLCDANLTLLTCNKRYQDIYSLPDALVQPGVGMSAIMHFLAERGELGSGAKDELVQAALEPLYHLREPMTFERRRPNGCYIETTAVPLGGGGYIATHADISALKQREEDLRRSRMAMEVRMLERSDELRQRKAMETELAEKSAWFKAAIDNIPGGMVLFDRDLRYYLWTKDVHKMWDLPPEMLKVGLPYAEVLRFFAERGDFGPGDIDALVEKALQPIRERKSIHVERHLASGTILDVRRNPLPNGGYVNLFLDITEKKRMEAALEARTEMLQAAIDNIPGGMLILNDALRCVFWSKDADALLELPAGLLRDDLPYAELLRFFAGRGDAGSQGMEALLAGDLQLLTCRVALSGSQRTPSGKLLEIRLNPMPAGGYVCLYEPRPVG